LYLLGVGSSARYGHLSKAGKAEVRAGVVDELLPFLGNAGRQGWALEEVPSVKAFWTQHRW